MLFGRQNDTAFVEKSCLDWHPKVGPWHVETLKITGIMYFVPRQTSTIPRDEDLRLLRFLMHPHSSWSYVLSSTSSSHQTKHLQFTISKYFWLGYGRSIPKWRGFQSPRKDRWARMAQCAWPYGLLRLCLSRQRKYPCVQSNITSDENSRYSSWFWWKELFHAYLHTRCSVMWLCQTKPCVCQCFVDTFFQTIEQFSAFAASWEVFP